METNVVNPIPGIKSTVRSIPVPGLIFIPDIGGFTKFVHEVDASIGSYVTYELLSTIIDENHLRLCISEIEGDAVFFYRYGAPPSSFEILRQYELMLRAFNERLAQINRELSSTFCLPLKLIAHYGPVAEYVIKGFTKLYGNAVVEAHVLLKNDIASHSYALLTDELIAASGKPDLEMLPNGLKSHSLCTLNGDIRNLSYTYFDY